MDIYILLRTSEKNGHDDIEVIAARHLWTEADAFQSSFFDHALKIALDMVSGHHEKRTQKGFKKILVEAEKSLRDTGQVTFQGDYLDELEDDVLEDELQVVILCPRPAVG